MAEYDTDVTIVDSFSYDGYGVLLQDNAVASSNPGKVGTQATNLLYAGEQFDVDAQQYYLRARWYNPEAGLYYTNRARSYDLYILRFLQSSNVNCIGGAVQIKLFRKKLYFFAAVFEVTN